MQNRVILAIVCAAISFCLAIFTFSAARTLGTTEFSGTHFFPRDHGAEFQKLELNAQEMRNRLEYMMFAKERDQSRLKLVRILQQQLNLTPYDGALWRELLFMSEGLDIADVERDEIFHTASTLFKWDYAQRVILSNKCVTQGQPEPSQRWQSICKDLLENLSGSFNLPELLRRMQVTEHALLDALKRYDVSVKGIN